MKVRRLFFKDPFNDILLTQQESDVGLETGSEDEGNSDEEEFDCEFTVSITVCCFSPPSFFHY